MMGSEIARVAEESGRFSPPTRPAVRKQRRLAAVVVLVPAAATVVAIITASRYGLHMVALISLAVM